LDNFPVAAITLKRVSRICLPEASHDDCERHEKPFR
jgi:hypothetical protein